jgi:hypothetical protein
MGHIHREESSSHAASIGAGRCPLTSDDFVAFQEAVLELNKFRDLPGFMKALPGIVLRLLNAHSLVAETLLGLKCALADRPALPRREHWPAGHVNRRSRTDLFDGRDLLLVELLRPHVIRAQHNAECISRLLQRNVSQVAIGTLTARQAEVARWMGMGKSNPEIALILS